MVDWTAVLIVTGLCVVMPIVVTGIVFRSKEHEINRKTDVLLIIYWFRKRQNLENEVVE